MMLESQSDYIMDKLQFVDDHGVSWLDVKREAMDAYNDELQSIITNVEILQALGSKYFRSPTSGRVVTQWPKGMTAYAELLAADRMDAFEINYIKTLEEAKL
jgi:hypothetical protein